MVQTSSLKGDLVPAMSTVARTIDPTAHSFSTSNPEAAAAWGHGDYQHAVALDPDFSGAWVNWVQMQIGARNLEGALTTANQALARPTLRSPIDRGQLSLMAATVRGDDNAREQSLVTLTRLLPNDPAVARTLANLEMNARQFPQAVKTYQDLIRLDPDDISNSNMLGYAQAFAGDLEGAKKSFEQYGREPDQEANSLDSLGEAMFLHGKFAEAESYFLQAHAKNSNMLAGGDLLKAAYARWLQGDLPKADSMFKQYKDFRTQVGDPVVYWREAVWEYSTGRPDQAISRLQGVSSEIATKQLVVWRDPNVVPHDPAILKPVYDRTPPSSDGLVRTLYASALMQAGKPEEAKKLITLWPLPESAGDELLRGFLYPKFLEIKRQLK
jgi:Flp pilus assembly protein TadD